MSFLDNNSLQYDLILIGISVLLGICIGAEREYRNKSAGLRTFILVCFGACLFTLLSIKIGLDDPDRIAANIITGIGFLGAGVIFKGDNKIDGITTATTIWATASIGMAIGCGYIYIAILGTVLVLLILSSLNYFQNVIDKNHKIREYEIAVSSAEDISYCENLFVQNTLKFKVQKQQKSDGNMITTWKITGKNINHERLILQMMSDEKIVSFQFYS